MDFPVDPIAVDEESNANRLVLKYGRKGR